MQKKRMRFSRASVDYYFGAAFGQLQQLTDRKTTVLITDENVFTAHQSRFKNWNTIVLKAGEAFKVQATADSIIAQLIEMEADRNTTVVGVGGGVVTDITGYIASVYMRGVRFGFVPTTLLALVDASIGGKNGVDVGKYKNLVGVVNQPAFILHDLSFLKTLPQKEWACGFAEIIKHACINDATMFKTLEKCDVKYYQQKKTELEKLVQRNALLKTKVVQQDEFEQGDRKLLNFGHTLGHALENQYELSHGEAVAIGMTYAANISEQVTGFKQPQRVVNLLNQYGLPTSASFNKEKAIDVLRMDKKKTRDSINFIVLEKIGKALIEKISIERLYKYL
jgi:3-dehydroquinate synthase